MPNSFARQFIENTACTLGFGAIVVLLGQLQIDLPNGMGIKSNLAELGIFMSLPFLRHWLMALALSLFTAFNVAPGGNVIAETLNHSIGIFFIWWYYRKSLAISNRWIYLACWPVAILIYYYAFMLPIFLLAHVVMGSATPAEAFGSYLTLSKSIYWEIVTTSLACMFYFMMLREYQFRLVAENDSAQLDISLNQSLERLKAVSHIDNSSGLPNSLQWECDLAQLEKNQASLDCLLLVGFKIDRLEQLYETIGMRNARYWLSDFATSCSAQLENWLSLHPVSRLPETQPLYHLEANLFVFLLHRIAPDESANNVIYRNQLLSIIHDSLVRHGLSGDLLSFQGGMTQYPQDADSLQQLSKNLLNLFRNYDERIHNQFIAFDPHKYAGHMRHEQLRTALPTSLHKHEFFLAFQPQWDTRSAQLAGFEALLRWDQPELGSISPGEFIPIAEQMDLIAPLTLQVVEDSCVFIRALRGRHSKPLRVAINLSPLLLTMEFLSQLLEQIRECDVAGGLEIEITESSMTRIRPDILEMLDRLRRLDITFSIDDFGTGYSNFSQLQNIEFDMLKIDMSLVSAMMKSEKSQKVVQSIINTAQLLGMTVIAEGVETAAERDHLNSLGCYRIQGYLYARPLSADAALALIKQVP